MKGRTYYVPIAFVAQTTAIDALEVVAPANGIIALKRVVLAQSTDFGDTEEEVLQIAIKRATGTYTSGSGGTTPTPTLAHQSDVAASFIAEVNNTTQAVVGTGALTTIVLDGWNVRGQYLWIPDDGEEISANDTDAIIMSISVPADSITIGGYAVIEEIGT